MKIRLQFVANSSSSSFVCEVCGETAEGRDASPSDFDMTYCRNGHVICNEHLLRDMTEEEFEEYGDEYEVMPELCPICQFQVMSAGVISPYLLETRGISRAEVFEKIKEINKRRKKLYDFEYVKYVFDKFELTEDIMLAELKEKFGTYDNFENRDKTSNFN